MAIDGGSFPKAVESYKKVIETRAALDRQQQDISRIRWDEIQDNNLENCKQSIMRAIAEGRFETRCGYPLALDETRAKVLEKDGYRVTSIHGIESHVEWRPRFVSLKDIWSRMTFSWRDRQNPPRENDTGFD